MVAVLVRGGIAQAQTQPAQQSLRVMIVSDFTIADLTKLESRGAVGLLVPGVGPTVNRRQALAALVRGAVENARLGGVPSGPPLIVAEAQRAFPTREPEIVVGLPPRGQPVLNDRRYPIAVVGRGYHGLLLSRTTRVPGIVSIIDVAPTALQRPGAMLLADGRAGAAAAVAQLEARIASNNQLKLPALVAVLVLTGFLILLRGRAALFAIPAALLGNLLLGIAGPSSIPILIGTLVVATAGGALLLERLCGSEDRLLALFAFAIGAYLVAMAIDPTWVAIAPLGPTQNTRFFGIGNQLETLFLAPVVAGAALAGRRFGVPGFLVFGAFGLMMVADNTFGADGGGAVVIGTSLAVLGGKLARLRVPGIALCLLVAAAAVLGLIWIDQHGSMPNHLRSAFVGGVGGLVAVARNRFPLAYEPAFQQWTFVAPFFVGFVAATTVVLRGRQTPGRRAVLLAVVAGVVASLLVNDSAAYELVGAVTTLVALRVSPLAFGPLRRLAAGDPVELAAEVGGE